MNQRERFLETLLFGTPDRIPLEPQSGRISTREAWYTQGLPKNLLPERIPEYAYRQAGGTLPWPEDGKGFPVSQRMVPMFEEKILEEKETTICWAAAEADIQFTTFDLSALKKQCLIFKENC